MGWKKRKREEGGGGSKEAGPLTRRFPPRKQKQATEANRPKRISTNLDVYTSMDLDFYFKRNSGGLC